MNNEHDMHEPDERREKEYDDQQIEKELANIKPQPVMPMYVPGTSSDYQEEHDGDPNAEDRVEESDLEGDVSVFEFEEE